VPPTLQPLGDCAPQHQIATGSGARETEAKNEDEDPDDDSKHYECGGHWPPYLNKETG
jgi:hypothetical protein